MWRLLVSSISGAVLLCGAARSATVEMVPIGSSGLFHISENTIAIAPGAQWITFEVRLSGWGPGRLRVYQVGLDAEVSTPDASVPALSVVACTDGDCAKLLSPSSACIPLCVGGERSHRTCLPLPGGECPQGLCTNQCEPVFVDTTRSDFVFAGQSALAAVSYAGTVLFGALPLTGVDPADPGTSRYIATVAIEVPAGWSGERTLGFDPDPFNTFVGVDTDANLVPVALIPGRIVIRCGADEDCDDGDLCTDDTCDVDVEQCRFAPRFDERESCCDPTTGAVSPLENDANECTLDRCRSGVTTHLFHPSGTGCGDPGEDTCDRPDTCNGVGFCLTNHRPFGTVCGSPSESVCVQVPRCDGFGNCVPRFAPPLTPCGVSGPSTICGGDFCDGAGNCIKQFAPAGSRCGDTVFDACDLVDECDGAGNCVDRVQPEGAPCGGGFATTCNPGDRCDGEGHCRVIFAPQGTACGNHAVAPCDQPDTCDGFGNCLVNYNATGTACGQSTSSECDDPDTCDGQGRCVANRRPIGTPCGDASESLCDLPDRCDGLGSCATNRRPDGWSCGDGLYCNGPERCIAGECAIGSPPCPEQVCHEDSDTCDPWNVMYAPFPPDQSTLWRQAHNEIRLRSPGVALPARVPTAGEILIQEMLPGGLYGPDISSSFSFSRVESGLFGEPELLIREEAAAFQHRRWYAVRALDGWPPGNPPILLEFQVQVGDALANGFVLAVDLAVIGARIPSLRVDANTIRMDITGDGRINAADLSAAFRRIPSVYVTKPSGH